MFFLPGTHKDHGLTYSPLKALISPRPIGWISSLSASGVANLSPYSFFNAIAELPPMVMFISAPDMREANRGGQKDSLANILETREFGVNIVGSEQAEQMVKSSQDVTADIDEFDHTSLGKKRLRRFLLLWLLAHQPIWNVCIIITSPCRIMAVAITLLW